MAYFNQHNAPGEIDPDVPPLPDAPPPPRPGSRRWRMVDRLVFMALGLGSALGWAVPELPGTRRIVYWLDALAQFGAVFTALTLASLVFYALRRRWLYVALMLVVLAGHTFVLAPDRAAHAPGSGAFSSTAPTSLAPLAPTQGQTLRVLSFNVGPLNPRGLDALDAAMAAEPDVAALIELPTVIVRAVYDTGTPEADALRARYPHRIIRAPVDTQNNWTVLLSRWPLEPLGAPDPKPKDPDYFPIAAKVRRPGDRGGPFIMIAVHASSPRSFGRWVGGNIVTDRAASIAVDHMLQHFPVVLAGDLNSTESARRPRVLTRAGLTLARPALNFEPTFPPNLGPVGAAIDHVLVSPGVMVTRFSTLREPAPPGRPAPKFSAQPEGFVLAEDTDSFGSDHRPLLVELVTPM